MLTKKDSRILFALALPLVVSGLVEASLGFTSTVFLSKLGPQVLAAGALVAWFFATMMIIVWGLFTAISVSVSHCHGANNRQGISHVLRDGFVLALVLALPITLLIWNLAAILQLLGQGRQLINIATPYFHALAWSILPDFTGLVLLQFVIGLGHARTNLVFTLSWVLLNIIANYILMFGHLGLPALGIAGLGWGTAFSFWITTIAWLFYLLSRRYYRPYFINLFQWQKPYYYWELIKVGIPTGAMWCIEITFFFTLIIIMGHIGINELAASQVAMQYTSLFVSILFSIAQAITVRVSNQLGAQNPRAIHNGVHAGLIMAVGIMLCLAIIAWTFPDFLISLDFNPHHATGVKVAHYARIFLAFACGFLLLEAIRIPLFGALRGLKDTRSTLLCSLLSFWLIAIPAGQLFRHYLHMGATGLWLGLLVSGFIGAAFLWWRYQKHYAANFQISVRQ
jgi:MATE family multidrug resistance protein